MEEKMNSVLAALTVVAAASCLLKSDKNAKLKRKRKLWTKERRHEEGSINFLTTELRIGNSDSFRNYLKMTETSFKNILKFVESDLKRLDTVMRMAIPAERRLAVTLRFLATGESFKSLESQTKLSNSFIGPTVMEVCTAIYKNMRREFLKFPGTKNEWKQIAEGFKLRWKFPLCMGALDGKHIAFRAAKTDSSLFYNCKGFNSIVLLALTDADYKFTFIDVGCNGQISDNGVLNRSDLMYIIENAERYFPDNERIGTNRLLPYVFIADDAFALQKHLLTPFPYTSTEETKKIFNERLSGARKTIEHAFYMLSNRFRVFQNTICLSPEKVKVIVQACCVLHNFLIENSDWSVEASFDSGIIQQNSTTPNVAKSSQTVHDIRDNFADYFSNEGRAPWQRKNEN